MEMIWLSIAIIIAVVLVVVDVVKLMALAIILLTIALIKILLDGADVQNPNGKLGCMLANAVKNKPKGIANSISKGIASPTPNERQAIPVGRKNSFPEEEDDLVAEEAEEPHKGEEQGYVSSVRGASKWPRYHGNCSSRSEVRPCDDDTESDNHLQPSVCREEHVDLQPSGCREEHVGLDHSIYVKDGYQRSSMLPRAEYFPRKAGYQLAIRSAADHDRREYERDVTESLEQHTVELQEEEDKALLLERDHNGWSSEKEEEEEASERWLSKQLQEEEENALLLERDHIGWSSQKEDQDDASVRWLAKQRERYLLSGSADAECEDDKAVTDLTAEDERFLEKDDECLLHYLKEDTADNGVEADTDTASNNSVTDDLEGSGYHTDEELINLFPEHGLLECQAVIQTTQQLEETDDIINDLHDIVVTLTEDEITDSICEASELRLEHVDFERSETIGNTGDLSTKMSEASSNLALASTTNGFEVNAAEIDDSQSSLQETKTCMDQETSCCSIATCTNSPECNATKSEETCKRSDDGVDVHTLDGVNSVCLHHGFDSIIHRECLDSVSNNEQIPEDDGEDEVDVGISDDEASPSCDGGIDSFESNVNNWEAPQNKVTEYEVEVSDDEDLQSFDEGIDSMESNASLSSITDLGQSQRNDDSYEIIDEDVSDDEDSLDLDIGSVSMSSSQGLILDNEHIQADDGDDELADQQMADCDEGFGSIESSESLTSVKVREQLQETVVSDKEANRVGSLFESRICPHGDAVESRCNGDDTFDQHAFIKDTQISEIITLWYKCSDTGKQTALRLKLPPQTKITALQIGDDNRIVLQDSTDEGYGSLESDADGAEVEHCARNETEVDISHTLNIGTDTVVEMEVSVRTLALQARAERLVQGLKQALENYEGERTGLSGNENHTDGEINVGALDSDDKQVCKRSSWYTKMILNPDNGVIDIQAHVMASHISLQVDEDHIRLQQVLSMSQQRENTRSSAPPFLFIQLGKNNFIQREKKYGIDNRLRRLSSLHGLRMVRSTDQYLVFISISASEDLLARIVNDFFADRLTALPEGQNDEGSSREILNNPDYRAYADPTVEKEDICQDHPLPNRPPSNERIHATVSDVTSTSDAYPVIRNVVQPKGEEPFSSQTRQTDDCVSHIYSNATTDSFSTEYLGCSSRDRRETVGDARHGSSFPDLACSESSRRRRSVCSSQKQSSAGLKRVKMKLLSEVNGQIVSALLEHSEEVQRFFEMLGMEVVAISRSTGVLTCRSDNLCEVVQCLHEIKPVIDNLWLAIIRGLEVRDGIHVMHQTDLHAAFWLEKQHS